MTDTLLIYCAKPLPELAAERPDEPLEATAPSLDLTGSESDASTDSAPRLPWAAVGAGGEISEFGEATLAQLAPRASGKRLVIAISATQLVLTRAAVPGSNAAKASRAVPFALEEQFGEDVEDLHFALGPRAADGGFPVAAIARRHIEALLAHCEAAGLSPNSVVPAPLLLPEAEDEEGRALWVATCDGQRVELRRGALDGFGAECELFGSLLPIALDEAGEEAPPALRLYASDAARAALPALRIETDEELLESPLHAFARGLGRPAIELLQGDYSRRQQVGKLWKPWKLTAALAAVWLLVSATQSLLEYRRLGIESERIEAQMSELLQETFPDVQRVVNPESQMRARLRKLQQGGGGDGNFVAAMAEVASALGGARDTRLQSIAFRAGRMELELEADALQSLDRLKQALEKSGQMSATIQSANQEGGKVRGRLRLENKS